MASTDTETQEKMKMWLKSVLKNEKLESFTFKNLGNTESGDGYLGDIVFVTVTGTLANGSIKTYDMVLKCSKKSQTMREVMPIKEAFVSEINLYQNIIPRLTQIQTANRIKRPFNSVPKYFGSFVGDNMEVIALENLKSLGYVLYPKKLPMTRKHVDLVVTEYAKFHASSLALKIKHPEEFDKLTDVPIMRTKFKPIATDMFKKSIEASCELLKNDLDEKSLSKWASLKEQVDYIMSATSSEQLLKVFIHGDCWNNNFMFLNTKNNVQDPIKVAFLDWQGACVDSPIRDLSYFLFTCSSKEDIAVLNNILITYHTTFINHLSQLGIEEPNSLYHLDQFFDEWVRFSIFGVLTASLLLKVVSYEKDEVRDIDKILESGSTLGDKLTQKFRGEENYKRRLLPIIEHAIKNRLL